MRSVDVVVVGAGPAGTAAAITAARAGLDVVVVDRARFPRDKICGDGLTTGAMRHLEHLGLDPADVDSWMTAQDCWIRSPSGRTTRFSLPQGKGQYVAIATRRDLDSALVDLARKAGADVLDGHAMTAASETADAVELDVEGIGTVRARWAIGADGMWSPLRKQLGVAAEGYRGEWHAFRQYVSDVGPLAARDLYISFEADILPGYFWSFRCPAVGRTSASGSSAAVYSIQDMKQLWPDLLERPHIRAVLGPDVTPDEPHRAWPIPARVDSVPPTTTRTLFVGDAVAACDVMTGDGIGQALATGMRAAESVVGAGPGGDGRGVRPGTACRARR
jgi:geranylgeranyl reductase family protein